jgi:small subunit ribosomal protein S16
MLVIRMQRTGRKGHAQFRVVVQDSRRTPTSGKIVARVGSYDPHSKNVNLNQERVQHYLTSGAQPSPRVVRLLLAEGFKLPKWVKSHDGKQKSAIKNPDKLRRNRPAEEKAEVSESQPGSTDEAAEAETPEKAAADTKVPADEENPAEQAAENTNEPASQEPEAAAETADNDSAASEQNG